MNAMIDFSGVAAARIVISLALLVVPFRIRSPDSTPPEQSNDGAGSTQYEEHDEQDLRYYGRGGRCSSESDHTGHDRNN
jgi:hypothetical protein